MRFVALMVCSIVLSTSGVTLGQDEPASSERSSAGLPNQQVDDEVVVTGKPVGQLRVAVEKARERAYGIFNEINSSNDFDFRCSDETRVFSHAKQRVCRPRFEGRITSTAATEYMSALTMTCPAGPTGFINFQACMTGAYAQRGQARAQAVSGGAPGMHDQLNDEILRLAGENDEFAQAILGFYAAQQEYDAARKPARLPKGGSDESASD
jgi:hypothetical protein